MSLTMDSQFVFVDHCQSATQSAGRSGPSDLQAVRRNNFRQRVRCKLKTSPSKPATQGRVRLEQTASGPSHDQIEAADEGEDANALEDTEQTGSWINQPDVENYSHDNRMSERMTKRRTSLHGKTFTVRISRNETKYRKFQAQTYNFLERPKSLPSIVYHVLV